MSKTSPNKVSSTSPQAWFFGILMAIVLVIQGFWAIKINEISWLTKSSMLVTWGVLAYFLIKNNAWRQTCIALLFFVIYEGLMGEVPEKIVLNETIRNLYFHVTMWMGMMILFFAAVVCAVLYLMKEDLKFDIYAQACSEAGMVMGVLGLLTGMIWAQYTWGTWWSNDPKQLYTAIGLLIYFSYFLIKGAIQDDVTKARISSIYHVFAFPSLIVLIYVLPRMMTSLHPGQEGNPAFSEYDLNDDMRVVFYPSIIAWTLLGVWIANIRMRTKKIELEWLNR